MSSSTIAAARASNEQRNCIADARQIMDMHLKRLGLLGDFEEVMHPSPPRTPGSIRGGVSRPTMNRPSETAYSPAGPHISRKTSFNLGLGAHPNQPRTNNRNAVKGALVPSQSYYHSQNNSNSIATQVPRAVTSVTVSRLTTPRSTPRSHAASNSAPSSASARSGDSSRKVSTPRVTAGLISSVVKRSLVVQKRMEAEERQLQGDLASIFPQPHNSSYSKAKDVNSSHAADSTTTFASEAARSIAVQSAANTSSRILKAAMSHVPRPQPSPHQAPAASDSTLVSDATADRVLRRVPNSSMSLSQYASPLRVSADTSQSSVHSSPSTISSRDNVQIPNTISDIGSADFCATINVGSTKGRLARALRIVQSLHNRVQQDGHVIKQLTREVQELRDTIKRRDEEVARVRSLMRQNELLSQSLAASERLLKTRDENDRSTASAGRSKSRNKTTPATTPRPVSTSYLAQFRPRSAAPPPAKKGAYTAVARAK